MQPLLMGLYVAEPEPTYPELHELDLPGYERKPVTVGVEIALEDALFSLELRAEWFFAAEAMVEWLALLTGAGELVRAKSIGPSLLRPGQLGVFTYSLRAESFTDDPHDEAAVLG